MAKAGQVIENPLSGERITFLKTAADTKGELMQAELAIRPGGAVPAAHIHRRQEERFEVISGRGQFQLGKRVGEVKAGESITVPAGTAHRVWNDSEGELRLLGEFRPAMQIETFFETFCGLATDGKSDKKGLPKPIHLALLLHDYEMFLAGPPLWLQKPLIASLAFIARRLGYRARYEKYSGRR